MVNKDIAEGKIGEVGAYDFELKDGNLTFDLGIDAGPATVSVKAALKGDALVDFLVDKAAKLIPGDSAAEVAILGSARTLLKAALKA